MFSGVNELLCTSSNLSTFLGTITSDIGSYAFTFGLVSSIYIRPDSFSHSRSRWSSTYICSLLPDFHYILHAACNTNRTHYFISIIFGKEFNYLSRHYSDFSLILLLFMIKAKHSSQNLITKYPVTSFYFRRKTKFHIHLKLDTKLWLWIF